MKEKNKRRAGYLRGGKLVAVIAVVAAFLVGTTALAVGCFGGWTMERAAEYEFVPAEEQLAEELGHKPIIVERFDNGYSYKVGYLENNQVSYADTGLADSFKSASFEYEKDGDVVYFSQMQSNTVKINGKLAETYKGVELYFYSFINRAVPEDHVLTEAEVQAEESGELIVNYGSESTVDMRVSSIEWRIDGVNYSLMQMDGKLSAQELTDMAKQLIG